MNPLTAFLTETDLTLCVIKSECIDIIPDWNRPYIVCYQKWMHWHHSWLKQTLHCVLSKVNALTSFLPEADQHCLLIKLNALTSFLTETDLTLCVIKSECIDIIPAWSRQHSVFIKLNALTSFLPEADQHCLLIKLNALTSLLPEADNIVCSSNWMYWHHSCLKQTTLCVHQIECIDITPAWSRQHCVFIKLNVLTSFLPEADNILCSSIWMHWHHSCLKHTIIKLNALTSFLPEADNIVCSSNWMYWHHSCLKQTTLCVHQIECIDIIPAWSRQHCVFIKLNVLTSFLPEADNIVCSSNWMYWHHSCLKQTTLCVHQFECIDIIPAWSTPSSNWMHWHHSCLKQTNIVCSSNWMYWHHSWLKHTIHCGFINLNVLTSLLSEGDQHCVFIKLNALTSFLPEADQHCVFINLNVLTSLLTEAHHTLCVHQIECIDIIPAWSRQHCVFIKLNALTSFLPEADQHCVFIKLNALTSFLPEADQHCVFIKLNALTSLLPEADNIVCSSNWMHWHHSCLKQTTLCVHQIECIDIIPAWSRQHYVFIKLNALTSFLPEADNIMCSSNWMHWHHSCLKQTTLCVHQIECIDIIVPTLCVIKIECIDIWHTIHCDGVCVYQIECIGITQVIHCDGVCVNQIECIDNTPGGSTPYIVCLSKLNA